MGVGIEGGAAVVPHLDGHGDPEAGRRLERLQRRAVELVDHREHGAVRVGEAGHGAHATGEALLVAVGGDLDAAELLRREGAGHPVAGRSGIGGHQAPVAEHLAVVLRDLGRRQRPVGALPAGLGDRAPGRRAAAAPRSRARDGRMRSASGASDDGITSTTGASSQSAEHLALVEAGRR